MKGKWDISRKNNTGDIQLHCNPSNIEIIYIWEEVNTESKKLDELIGSFTNVEEYYTYEGSEG